MNHTQRLVNNSIKVADIILDNDISVAQAAKLIGLSTSSIYNMINGPLKQADKEKYDKVKDMLYKKPRASFKRIEL